MCIVSRLLILCNSSITTENKFDDAIYNYLYAYWKEQSGEYDPKDDEIIMTKENSFTKNEKKFEQWLLQQYGMTNKEQREYTLKGNLESLWEIFSAADMVLFARGLPSIGKELAQLGKKAVDDVAEEAIEKTVKKEAAESTAKKEVADTAEDLSQKTVKQEEALKDSSRIKEESETSHIGEYLAQKAPKQVAPGTRFLEGQYVNDLGQIQPWKAYYDEYGRLIARTDYNAGNIAQGIPDVHYHLYEWGPGKTPYEYGSHIKGEYKP